MKQILNERFLYFPLLGLIVSALALVQYLIVKFPKSLALKPVLACLLLLVFAFFARGTILRLADWETENSLWSREVSLHPDSWRNQKNLAFSLESENSTGEALTHYIRSMDAAKKSGRSEFYLASAKALAFAY
ncbi:MAG: hypothetical protein HYW88_00310, partial [Candidatus Sungbacteria bacterium]|nr:hypothetical protein [Candidatus Sungbacteria bacterium]